MQNRRHIALQNSKEYRRLLLIVGINILVSAVALLLLWVCLLQMTIDVDNRTQLPKSYVPPIQAVVWSLINDILLLSSSLSSRRSHRQRTFLLIYTLTRTNSVTLVLQGITLLASSPQG
ncbi:hypothetical protein F5Y16DRAFT_385921 [Xylariaceae sp. FL0255]|nr:hypothetical protein F5Y16DRAFT_385921 [Xylariaceae sp. FL0255]